MTGLIRTTSRRFWMALAAADNFIRAAAGTSCLREFCSASWDAHEASIASHANDQSRDG